jgi:hypothetical protein
MKKPLGVTSSATVSAKPSTIQSHQSMAVIIDGLTVG